MNLGMMACYDEVKEQVTARMGSGLIDVREAARLEDVEDSGPGRVERAPRRRGARRAKAARKRSNEDDDEWDGED